MLVRFGMSPLTGLGFWTFTAAYGLDLSREWGVIAFVLNFIPFIGSFIATILPTLLAAAQVPAAFSRNSWRDRPGPPMDRRPTRCGAGMAGRSSVRRLSSLKLRGDEPSHPSARSSPS
jgi:hypothetical protein